MKACPESMWASLASGGAAFGVLRSPVSLKLKAWPEKVAFDVFAVGFVADVAGDLAAFDPRAKEDLDAGDFWLGDLLLAWCPDAR